MKKYILIMLLLVPPLYGAAQGLDFNGFFAKYTGDDDCTTMEFTGALLQMMAGGSDGAFSGVKSFKMITTDKPGAAFRRDAMGITTQDGYQSLVNITDGGTVLKILHKEKGKGRNSANSEYLMVAIDDNSITALYIEGDIDFRNIAKLTKLGKGDNVGD